MHGVDTASGTIDPEWKNQSVNIREIDDAHVDTQTCAAGAVFGDDGERDNMKELVRKR